jgi:hypothetical protein
MLEHEVTDEELARFADWAERMEVAATDPQWKKAYGAVRQGSDWLLRRRAIKKHEDIEGKKENVKVMKQ